MKITFRARALDDLSWWKSYYKTTFTEGAANAKKHYRAASKILSVHPEVGHIIEGFANVRQFQIARTPFSFLYLVENNQIVVLRVLDQRSDPLTRL